MTRRRLEQRLDRLEAGGREDDPDGETTIRNMLIDQEGNLVGVFSELRIWQDDAGEWHSEKETYELPNDRIDPDEENDFKP